MPISPAAVITAAALSLSTLGVFRAAQSLGPDAAVRRFVMSVRTGNFPEAQRLAIGDLNSTGGQVLIAMARNMPDRFQIADRESRGDVVLVVLTGDKGGSPAYEAFVVRRVNGYWGIDVDGTATLRLQSMIPQ